MLTAIYEKWRSSKSCKFNITLNDARGNYKVSSLHLPAINPIDPFKLTLLIQPYSLHKCPLISARVIQLQHALKCYFLYYTCVMIFSFATFESVPPLINRCQTWSIYRLWRKMRYQNVDEKIPQTSVSIMSPCNKPDLKLGPLIQVQIFFFWGVYNTAYGPWSILYHGPHNKYLDQQRPSYIKNSRKLEEGRRLTYLGISHHHAY